MFPSPMEARRKRDGVVPGATGRPAEGLRERGGVMIVGTAGSSTHMLRMRAHSTTNIDSSCFIVKLFVRHYASWRGNGTALFFLLLFARGSRIKWVVCILDTMI